MSEWPKVRIRDGLDCREEFYGDDLRDFANWAIEELPAALREIERLKNEK